MSRVLAGGRGCKHQREIEAAYNYIWTQSDWRIIFAWYFKRSEEQRLHDSLSGLCRLAGKGWWKRLWVVQEVALAMGRVRWDEDIDEAPGPGEDPIISNRMTDAEKSVIITEIKRNHLVRRVQAAMNQSVQERTARTNYLQLARAFRNKSKFPRGPNYVEPQFTPPCPRFVLIAQYLLVHQQELALDSMHLEIAEHQLYWYVVREGFTGLTPTEWRGFLQRCNAEGVLFEWTEYLSPPTPTQGTVIRIDNGWPIQQIQKTPPDLTSNIPAALRLRTILPVFIRNMEAIGRGYCAGIFTLDQYDFDKRIVLETLRREMQSDGGWTSMRLRNITEFEFDQCVRYMESINEQWTFGPKGIIRKTDVGW